MRKSYLEYLYNRARASGPTALPKYAARYAGTYAGYLLKKSISGPIEGDLCLTYNCNLRCTMCDLPFKHQNFVRQKRPVLELEDYKSLISDFRDIGTSGIGISGGEPFLHRDLLTIIQAVKDSGMVCQITTNGWYITEKNYQNFLDTKIDNVTISIDGHNAEVHDRLRGKKGSFQRAIEAIKLLTQQSNSKTKVYINSVLSYDNIEYFPELIETAKQSGAHGISFIPLHSIGDSKTTSPNYTNDERETVLKSVEQLCGAKAKDPYIESSLEYLRLFKNFFLGEPLPISCFAGYTTLLVDCYGDIYPCFTFYETNRSFANVRDYGGLKEYWYSKNLKRSRNEIRGCRECYWDCQVETNLLYKHLGSARRS